MVDGEKEAFRSAKGRASLLPWPEMGIDTAMADRESVASEIPISCAKLAAHIIVLEGNAAEKGGNCLCIYDH